MDDLLKHHIRETERRFDEIMEELDDITIKIDSLQEFKITTHTSSKWISVIISSLVGFLTFTVTVAVTYFTGR